MLSLHSLIGNATNKAISKMYSLEVLLSFKLLCKQGLFTEVHVYLLMLNGTKFEITDIVHNYFEKT